MSSPHLAGSAALVRAVHPTWLPSEVKSALMMTSFNGGKKQNGTTPWDPDDVGTGRVDLTQAAKAGLVMNETFANYLAANPSTGGDPRTVNTPSVRDMNCTPICTWTRTVRNTKTVPTSWTAAGSAITPGFAVNVVPPSFNFSGDVAETQLLTITATPLVNLTAAVAFGQVLLTETGAVSPNERITVAIKGLPGAGTPTAAVSRRTHSGAGTFDVNLPLTGTPGIECSTGGATNDYTIVVAFSGSVSVSGSPQAEVISGTGTIGSGGVSNGGMVTISGNTVTIPLTNVPTAQTINVRLNSVNGSTNVTVPMGVLVGDTNGDGFVNAGDAVQTRSGSGQATNATNFRSDVNADGSVNSGDTTVVRARSGTFLP